MILRRVRRGFTLIELLVVLIIIAIIADVTIPALLRLGQENVSAIDDVRQLLIASRNTALTKGIPVRVVIDPATGDYRVDTMSANGIGAVAIGTINSNGGVAIETDSIRAKFFFMPTGIAFGDSMLVRSSYEAYKVYVDPLTGVFRAEPR